MSYPVWQHATRSVLTDAQVKTLQTTLDNFKALLTAQPDDGDWDPVDGLSERMLTQAFIHAMEHTAVEDLRWYTNELLAYSSLCVSNKRHAVASISVYRGKVVFITDNLQLTVSDYTVKENVISVGYTTNLTSSYFGPNRSEPLDIQKEQKKIRASIVTQHWDGVTARSINYDVQYCAFIACDEVPLMTNDQGLLVARDDQPLRSGITYTLISGSPATEEDNAARDGVMFIDLNTRDIWHGSIVPYEATVRISTAAKSKYLRYFTSGKFLFTTQSERGAMMITALGYTGGSSLSGTAESTDIPSIPVRHTVKLQRDTIVAIAQYMQHCSYFVVATVHRMISMYDTVTEYIMVDADGSAEVIARCAVTAQYGSNEVVDTRVEVLNEEMLAASPYKSSETYAKDVTSVRAAIEGYGPYSGRPSVGFY